MRAERFTGGRGVMLGAAVVGALGLLITLVGFFVAPGPALHSYLVAFCYWTGLGVAALILLCIFHASHARWMVVLRRAIESIPAALWLMVPLFLPIAVGMAHLYPWVEPPAGLSEHELGLLEHKRAYLNPPFFLLRAALYFGCWVLVAELLRRWSVRQDESGDGELTSKQRRLGAGALPALAVTLTFASVDWLMSLEPLWFSTVFGVYFFAGSFVSAIAVVTLCAALAFRRELDGGLATPEHLHSLGKLLFAFVCFWAYIAYSQYMLMWIADLPEEVPWYLARTGSGWRRVALLLFVGHFVVPFVALLSARLKRRPGPLAALAGWILLMHFVDLYWVVMPALHRDAPRVHWTDFSAFFGVGGAAVAFALFRLRGGYAVPVRDPFLAASVRYTQP